jgi:hypothetical protein
LGRQAFPGGPIAPKPNPGDVRACRAAEGTQRLEAKSSDCTAQEGSKEIQDRQMTVLIYVDTSKQVGDADHLKVFANADAAETWFEENDPEGVAFEYEVLE